MSAFIEISLVLNVILCLVVLYLTYLKYTEHSKIKKNYAERKAKKVQNLKKAQFVRTVREEVRRYLKEPNMKQSVKQSVK